MARPLAIRQQALATAQVYVRRFYTKVEIRRTNPALVLATALYLACKMEECPQHIRMVLAEARHCWGMYRCHHATLTRLTEEQTHRSMTSPRLESVNLRSYQK